MNIYVCEECGTHTTDEARLRPLHLGHHVLGIGPSEDYDELQRLAENHLRIVHEHLRESRPWIKLPTFPPPWSDWNSDEDSDCDDAANA